MYMSYLCNEGVVVLLDLLPDAPQPLQRLHLTLTLLPLLRPAQHPTHQHYRYLKQHPHPCAQESPHMRKLHLFVNTVYKTSLLMGERNFKLYFTIFNQYIQSRITKYSDIFF